MRTSTILIAILGVGLIVRLLGIRYGLPLDVMGDEFVHIYTAFTLLDEMTLRALSPMSYVPSLFAVMLIPITLGVGAIGLVLGVFDGLAGFKEFAIMHSTDFITAGRVLSALFGTATIYLTYKIVKACTSEWPALFAAALMAADFWFMHESNKSHFWVPATAFMIYGMYALIELARRGTFSWYLKSVAAIAVGVWMGFFPIILAPFLAVAHFHTPSRKTTYLAAAGGILAAAVVVVAWLNPLSIMRQFGRAIRSTLDVVGLDVFPQFVGPSDNPTDPLQNLFALLQTLFWDNPFVFVFGLVGLGLMLYMLSWRSIMTQLMLGIFTLYLAVAIFIWPHPDDRYILPLILPLMVGTAFLVQYLYTRYASQHAVKMILWGAVVCTLGYSLYVTGMYGSLLLKPDTRTLAREWIFANVPDGERVFMSAQFFDLPKSREAITFYVNTFPEALRAKDRTAIELPQERFPKPAYFAIEHRYAEDLGAAAQQYTYLVAGFNTPEERIAIPTGFKKVASFYPEGEPGPVDDLLLGPDVVIQAVGAVSHLGPNIEIYKRVE